MSTGVQQEATIFSATTPIKNDIALYNIYNASPSISNEITFETIRRPARGSSRPGGPDLPLGYRATNRSALLEDNPGPELHESSHNAPRNRPIQHDRHHEGDHEGDPSDDGTDGIDRRSLDWNSNFPTCSNRNGSNQSEGDADIVIGGPDASSHDSDFDGNELAPNTRHIDHYLEDDLNWTQEEMHTVFIGINQPIWHLHHTWAPTIRSLLTEWMSLAADPTAPNQARTEATYAMLCLPGTIIRYNRSMPQLTTSQ